MVIHLFAAIALATSLAPAPAEPAPVWTPPAKTGRFYTSPHAHVGARLAVTVASGGEWGFGGTLQLTVRTPW